jgi:hypothetical protein
VCWNLIKPGLSVIAEAKGVRTSDLPWVPHHGYRTKLGGEDLILEQTVARGSRARARNTASSARAMIRAQPSPPSVCGLRLGHVEQVSPLNAEPMCRFRREPGRARHVALNQGYPLTWQPSAPPRPTKLPIPTRRELGRGGSRLERLGSSGSVAQGVIPGFSGFAS